MNLAWQTELELPDRRTSDSRLHAATVTAVRTLTPRMIRLTLAGLTLVGLQTRPAQDIELLLADRDLKRIKRRYTIRHCRPEAGELDIDLFLHDYGGPGSNWAHQAHPGSTAEFIGPKGKLELRPADWHLFVGDEASLPAIADLTEALGGDQISIALLEVTDEADQLPLVATDVRWLHRRTEPPGTPQFLLARCVICIHLKASARPTYLARAAPWLRSAHLSPSSASPLSGFSSRVIGTAGAVPQEPCGHSTPLEKGVAHTATSARVGKPTTPSCRAECPQDKTHLRRPVPAGPFHCPVSYRGPQDTGPYMSPSAAAGL